MAKTKDQVLEDAIKYLDIPTLEVRGRDCLDFYDIGIRSLKKVLEMAYDVGYEAGLKKTSTAIHNGG